MADYLLREDDFKFLHEDDDGFILRELSTGGPPEVGFRSPVWPFYMAASDGTPPSDNRRRQHTKYWHRT